MEEYIKIAHKVAKDEALFSFERCKYIADNLQIDYEYFIEVYIREINKLINK